MRIKWIVIYAKWQARSGTAFDREVAALTCVNRNAPFYGLFSSSIDRVLGSRLIRIIH